MRHTLSFSALAIAIAFSSPALQAMGPNLSTRSLAPSPKVPGQFAIASAEYKFPASVDPDVLATAATELWARAYWPKKVSGALPIVFLLHGNHSTCGEGTPRNDYDCTYTAEGTCPVGQVVVPNHEGYNYLGQQLASLGYIVVSINANRGITCGNGNDADWGLNLARGRLVLRHIEEWNKWATAGGAPTSLGVAPDAFLGHVDITNVGLMGHSRGGEGMRAALTLYRDQNSIWPARIPNLKIRGIFEIASVDGQAGRVLDADDTAWNQLLPMCDGDVSNLEGRMPFERMIKKSVETRKTPKSLTYVFGTNHNFYNTEWHSDDSYNCVNHTEIHGPGPTSTNQQMTASIELSAFMLANVGANAQPAMGRLFDPSYLIPSDLSKITRVDRDHIYTFDRTFSAVVDDFDQPTGTSSSHKTNASSGVDVENELSTMPPREIVTWTTASANNFVQLNWADAGQGKNVSGYTSLDLRVGRQLDQIKEAPTLFSIALVDSKGRVSTPVSSAKYIDVSGPYNDETLYQTMRIPLGDFGLAGGVDIQGVRLIFDRSALGHLNFANVRFTANNPVAFMGSLNEPLPWQTPIVIPKEDEDLPTPPHQTPTTKVVNRPNGPNGNAPRMEISKADLLATKLVLNSKYMSGGPAIEVLVRASKGRFPVEAQLPTLVMAGNKFSVSRFAPTGRTDTMIFSISQKDVRALPSNGSMHIQYGRVSPRKFWRMEPFEKSQFDR